VPEVGYNGRAVPSGPAYRDNNHEGSLMTGVTSLRAIAALMLGIAAAGCVAAPADAPANGRENVQAEHDEYEPGAQLNDIARMVETRSDQTSVWSRASISRRTRATSTWRGSFIASSAIPRAPAASR